MPLVSSMMSQHAVRPFVDAFVAWYIVVLLCVVPAVEPFAILRAWSNYADF